MYAMSYIYSVNSLIRDIDIDIDFKNRWIKMMHT